VLTPDGGITESVQKRIPILLKSLDVAMFPEGGDLIEGLPGRVYLSAKNSLGKPADVEGRVVDDRGAEIASFKSLHDGMARFDVTPAAGRAYRVEITRPAGIARTFEIPAAKRSGCVLRTLDGSEGELELAAWCSEAQTLIVEAVLRERRIAGGRLRGGARRPTRIALPVTADTQGAVRVTLFDAKENPLAERLVYRGRGRDLKVEITADRKSYAPRDPVTLSVTTRGVDGKPIAASLGLAVVDDTVLSFADDKSARILAASTSSRSSAARSRSPTSTSPTSPRLRPPWICSWARAVGAASTGSSPSPRRRPRTPSAPRCRLAAARAAALPARG
jgi:hypothetical protein